MDNILRLIKVRVFCTSLFGLVLFAACGPRVVLRPIELLVSGLSGQAERLVVLVFPGDSSPGCSALTLRTASSLEAPVTAEWTRESGAERILTVPAVEEDEVMLAAYSEDAQGKVIQIGCAELTYAELEVPDVSIVLTAQIP